MRALVLGTLLLITSSPVTSQAQTVETPCSAVGITRMPGMPPEGQELCSGNNLIPLNDFLPIAASWNSQHVGDKPVDQGMGSGISFLSQLREINPTTVEMMTSDGSVKTYTNGISSQFSRRDISFLKKRSPTEYELRGHDNSLTLFSLVAPGQYLPKKTFDTEGRPTAEFSYAGASLQKIDNLLTRQSVTLTSGPRGKISTIRDGSGRAYNLTYTNDKLTKIQGPGVSRSFTYSPTGVITEVRDGITGRSMFYDYFPGNILRGQSDGSVSTAYNYSASSITATALSMNGKRLSTTKVDYVAVGPKKAFSSQTSLNGVTLSNIHRNSDGNPISITDTKNIKETFTYTAGNPFPVEKASPSGREVISYDSTFRELEVRHYSPGGELARSVSYEYPNQNATTPSVTTIRNQNGTPVQQIAFRKNGNTITQSVTSIESFSYSQQNGQTALARTTGPSGSEAVQFDVYGDVKQVTTNGVTTDITRTISPTTRTVTVKGAGLERTTTTSPQGSSTTLKGGGNNAVTLDESITCQQSSLGGARTLSTGVSSSTGQVKKVNKSSWTTSPNGVSYSTTNSVAR